MAFTAPLGLLALLAVPAVLALHLFRRRYRPRAVAGLFLFAPDALVASAGRTRTPLVRSLSLWLELAAAALCALWLAGPRLTSFGAPPHLVLVLDDSASMSARGNDGVTFAARAREVVGAELRAAGGDVVVTLIVTGPRPRVLCGPQAPAAVARTSLQSYDPQRVRHDMAPALALATELAGERGTILFLTDDPNAVTPPGCAVRAVGESLDNTALVHARRVAVAGKERVLVDATAFAAAPVATTLTLRRLEGGGTLLARTIELPPGRVARFDLEVPAGTGALEVSLPGDALAVDDRFVLLPEPLRPVSVAVRLPAATVAELQLGHALRALGSAVRIDQPEADLEIVDAGSEGPWSVQLVVAPGTEPVESWIGPFLTERRHPLLRGVTLEGVIWSAGRAAIGRGLVFAGDVPLLGEETLGDRVRIQLALDPARSNLATSPDWPILLANAVDLARARLPGAAQHNLRLGDPVTWRRRPQEDAREELHLRDDAGQSTRGVGARVVTFDTWRAGMHRLLRGETELARFAVNFVDARESDLRACGTAVRPAAPAPESDLAAASVARGEFERRWLALLLLAVAALDWWVLSRQRAVEVAA
jgi:hypothetical protein